MRGSVDVKAAARAGTPSLEMCSCRSPAACGNPSADTSATRMSSRGGALRARGSASASSAPAAPGSAGTTRIERSGVDTSTVGRATGRAGGSRAGAVGEQYRARSRARPRASPSPPGMPERLGLAAQSGRGRASADRADARGGDAPRSAARAPVRARRAGRASRSCVDASLERNERALRDARSRRCANDSYAKSASGGPRQRASASRRASGSPRSTSRLEALEIELARFHPDRVPGRARGDAIRSQQFAELRDVVLDGVRRGSGLLGPPKVVDEPIRRDDLVRPREQQGEHGALARPAETDRRDPRRRLRAARGSGTPSQRPLSGLLAARRIFSSTPVAQAVGSKRKDER